METLVCDAGGERVRGALASGGMKKGRGGGPGKGRSGEEGEGEAVGKVVDVVVCCVRGGEAREHVDAVREVGGAWKGFTGRGSKSLEHVLQ